jgi:hypothetical protein
MPRPRVAPGRLRRRLTIAFTLAGGLAAATLAASSYLVVRDARLDDSVETACERERYRETPPKPSGRDAGPRHQPAPSR